MLVIRGGLYSGGLIFGGAYIRGGYIRDFTVCTKIIFSENTGIGYIFSKSI